MKSDLGNYFPFIDGIAQSSSLDLSYLSKDWPDAETWRTEARSRMAELLGYQPAPFDLDPEVVEEVPKDGYTRRLVRYAVGGGRRTEAYLLIPDGAGRGDVRPAVMVLHDHSGFYYSGKEKMAAIEGPSAPLAELIEETYEGRPVADELARRGFIVLVPDCFYFGSQRLDPKWVSDRFTKRFEGLEPGAAEYIRAFNSFASEHEAVTAKSLLTAGVNWSGLMLHDDRAGLDYLLGVPGVDPARVGCIGLSLGGFRSAHLFGLDGRIRAGVVAGWMTTYRELLFDHLRFHTWMLYIPRQYPSLDLPDVVALNGPNPLMVIQCGRDHLFTPEGMRKAEEKIRAIYAKMGAGPDRFECRTYDVPHSLNIEMQNDGIAFLEKHLRP